MSAQAPSRTSEADSRGAMTATAKPSVKGRSPLFLFVFDFDHTLIDANSDLEIQGAFNTSPVPEHLKIVAKNKGWTSYMQEVFRFHYGNSIKKDDFCKVLDKLPWVEGIVDCIRKIYDLGAELIVLSDANTFFIQYILETNNLMDKFNQIFSNPAQFDDSGQLVIKPYHSNLECKLSSRNLCKGRVLMEYVRQRSEEGQRFNFIGYAGDGVNDFCPMARLHSGDLACPRKDYSICDFIKKKEDEDDVFLRAKMVYWTHGAEITKGVQDKLKQLNLCV